MALKNLSDLRKTLLEDYKNFKGIERELPETFKSIVRDINGANISYGKYVSEITTTTKLKLYVPNQWFYIAAIFTEYYLVIQEYRNLVLNIYKDKLVGKTSVDKEAFFSSLKGKDHIQEVRSYLEEHGYQNEVLQWLVSFVTDYDWWGGGKAICRADVMASAIISCAGLVNDSSSYVVSLCGYLANNKEAYNALMQSYSSANIHTADVLPISSSSHSSYLTALQTKPFLLLAGISGTGKSRIVREFAFKSCPEYLQDEDHTTPGNYLMVEVKPNWHDSSELLGYYSNLTNNGKGAYIFTPFVKFLIKAMMFPDVPFFVCLDEMNLAPVEQYFAEFLSVLETRKKTEEGIKTSVLVAADNFKGTEAEKGDGYLAKYFFGNKLPFVNSGKYCNFTLRENGLTLPDNVFIIGTVNMDDTTHQFSRKVIDRAMTIEMNGGDLMSMFGGSKDMDYLPAEEQWTLDQFQPRYVTADEALEAHPDVAEDIKRDLTSKLDAINLVLENTPFQVSYRVLNELTIHMVVLLENGKSYDDALAEAIDQILLMKILPRIEGDKDLLMVGNESRINQLNKFAISDTTKDKLSEMQLRLERQEFTRFWP